MLFAPLIAFLSDAVVDDDDSVETEAAYHRLRDAAACRDLRDTGLKAQCIDDVCGRSSIQHRLANDGDGRG